MTHHHTKHCKECERLRAENLRLEGEWFVLTADKQLLVREVERLRKHLALVREALTSAFESLD